MAHQECLSHPRVGTRRHAPSTASLLMLHMYLLFTQRCSVLLQSVLSHPQAHCVHNRQLEASPSNLSCCQFAPPAEHACHTTALCVLIATQHFHPVVTCQPVTIICMPVNLPKQMQSSSSLRQSTSTVIAYPPRLPCFVSLTSGACPCHCLHSPCWRRRACGVRTRPTLTPPVGAAACHRSCRPRASPAHALPYASRGPA